MLQFEATVAAVPRHHNAITIMTDERKRSASEQDDAISLPPAKRRAPQINLDDGQQTSEYVNMKFGQSGSPWTVDITVSSFSLR
jgi:hypothetical protein